LEGLPKYIPNGDLSNGNHVYGYAVANLLTVVLKQCGDDLTRASVMKQAANLKGVEIPLALPGIKVNTSPTDFYPIQSVQPARQGRDGGASADPVQRSAEPVVHASRGRRTIGGRTAFRAMTEIATRFERIKPRPAYELVAEAIERKILAGRLKPGDPVGTESELVRQFGVNRSTVREGIRLLEQSGLVSREPSRRLSVAVPHYHRLATRMTRALILQQVTFRELWHASRALEPAAVDQAMDNATEETWPRSRPTSRNAQAAARSGRRRRATRSSTS
jgi:DNA-binding transcriptional regulator YhcF (GntR family)